MKIWEGIIEARLRDRVEINEQQYGFMPEREPPMPCCFNTLSAKDELSRPSFYTSLFTKVIFNMICAINCFDYVYFCRIINQSHF